MGIPVPIPDPLDQNLQLQKLPHVSFVPFQVRSKAQRTARSCLQIFRGPIFERESVFVFLCSKRQVWV